MTCCAVPCRALPSRALLEAESTRSLQILIDRAHGGSTGITPPPGAPVGAGRDPNGQPPGLRDGEAPREAYIPRP